MIRGVTASILYNLVQCPHRVNLDLFGNPADKDPISSFVQLLWDKGNAFEKEVIEDLEIPFTDLSAYVGEEKEVATIEAMRRGDGLIYSGRIRADDLIGEPDLLRRRNQRYVAGDIKSGAGEEGTSDLEDRKPKKHYAVQLALYTDILEKLGFSEGRTPFIWDVHGEETIYDLDAPKSKTNANTLWDLYQEHLVKALLIISGKEQTLPAYAGTCKLCHWRTVCTKALKEANDLTLIPDLGRAKRDAMLPYFKDLSELAKSDIDPLIKGKKTVIPGVGPDSLRKFQSRAQLLLQPNSKGILKEPVNLPASDVEIFFDVETDPMRDICYLHGFVERKNRGGGSERYLSFFANEPAPQEEERAFAEAWRYLKGSRSCLIYYYTKYERTWWKKLQKKYPDVATQEEIEDLFSSENSIDLYYDVVRGKTEWPTHDHSIKTLASYLGFSWRDPDPSGASSVVWYHRWVESKDEEIRQRILKYNEDDCKAMRVLLDGVRSL